MPNSIANRQQERRRYPRLTATGDTAFVMLPEEKISGVLIDIGMGGMSFHYRGSLFQMGSLLQQGILFGEDDLWLENLPTKTVHDFADRIPVAADESLIRRRCLQFCGLSENQQSLLAQFIERNAESKVASSSAADPG